MKNISATILRYAVIAFMGLTIQSCNCPEPYVGYLFAYFEGSGEPMLQEQLRFAVSRDARHWEALNGNRPIMMADTVSHSGGIRDPHILRGEDGHYYIVATDMLVAKNGWRDNPGIVLMRSDDLIHWSHAAIHLAQDWPAFADAFWVWAPQVIYDPEIEKYMVYFTLQRTNDGRSTLITYYAYANEEFTAFESEPQPLFSAKYGSIDNDIVYHKGIYHLFYKGNTKDANGHEFKNGIQQATSQDLHGPWNEDFRYLDVYADTQTGVEGSSVFKLNDSEEFVLMYDVYGSGRYEYQTSTDLVEFTDKPLSFTKNFNPRHGSVISITESEMQRVVQYWGTDLK